MKTPEQTRQRRYDIELLELRKENARLGAKIVEMRKVYKETVLELAKLIPSYRHRHEIETMANTLEVGE